jgi:predicted nucleic acid-binding protein
MGRTVLIDSGCIVAALHKRDQHHAWARAHFEAFVEPCMTCQAALSESFFLLERTREGKQALCALLERKVILLSFSMEDDVTETLRLLRRYGAIRMSLADACLVRMAELIPYGTVFTTDSDFATYRKHGRQIIPLITPTSYS